MVNRWRLPSASPMGSTLGRWMINMAMPPSGWTELLRVELDDERLAHGHVDVLASRLVEDRDAERLVARFEPRRRESVERVEVVAQLEPVLGLAHPAPAVLAGRVRSALDRALHGVALGALEEQLHLLAPAQPADGAGVAGHQTRRRLGGRQPLCGMGVTSLMPAT